jgi:hypothetical protein
VLVYCKKEKEMACSWQKGLLLLCIVHGIILLGVFGFFLNNNAAIKTQYRTAKKIEIAQREEDWSVELLQSTNASYLATARELYTTRSLVLEETCPDTLWPATPVPSVPVVDPMNVMLVSTFGRKLAALQPVGVANRVEYCALQGCSFRLDTESGAVCPRVGGWLKITALQAAMAATPIGTPEVTHFIWLDADLLFMNFHFRLTDLIARYPDKELLTSMNHGGINTGVMVLRNNEWAREFLNRVWSREDLADHKYWEQEAIKQLLESDPSIAAKTKLVDGLFPSDNTVKGYFRRSMKTRPYFFIHLFGRCGLAAERSNCNSEYRQWGIRADRFALIERLERLSRQAVRDLHLWQSRAQTCVLST